MNEETSREAFLLPLPASIFPLSSLPPSSLTAFAAHMLTFPELAAHMLTLKREPAHAPMTQVKAKVLMSDLEVQALLRKVRGRHVSTRTLEEASCNTQNSAYSKLRLTRRFALKHRVLKVCRRIWKCKRETWQAVTCSTNRRSMF